MGTGAHMPVNGFALLELKKWGLRPIEWEAIVATDGGLMWCSREGEGSSGFFDATYPYLTN
jgi:hypothetical protein